MQEWFTLEVIDSHTYALSEYLHWEQAHAYLIIGSQSALLIDTGLGIANIRKQVEQLTDLPVQVVTTHVHWDHIGGHGQFEWISVHEDDAYWLIQGIPLPLELIRRDVIKGVNHAHLPAGLDITQYIPFTGCPSRLLKDGDLFDLGNRTLQVLHTPGHSPGHICLWEQDQGYLFTGDLLYEGTLYAHYPSTDPVAYRDSVARIAQLPNIKRLLPAHNALSIPVDLASHVRDAFDQIADKGLLHHGGGVFTHPGFAIQI